MDTPTFERLFDRRCTLCYTVLTEKNLEYAPGDDRLQNFKEGALFLESSPVLYAFGLMTKHLVALKDRVVKGDTNTITQTYVDEKIGDIINYLILIEALLTEELYETKSDV
jgi:hypothetical protein